MNTETQKLDIAQAFLNGLRTRDWDAMRALMTEDIVWNLPGASRISGLAAGREAVIGRSQTIVGYGLQFALERVLFGPEGFALILNNTARRAERVLDEHLATVCRLRDGKIASIDTYLSDVEMANAFFV